ncbi:MAG: hypothetical protein NZ934_01625, partial [Hadesarchaea archaeon]|nr:hypothetical protein [Hadesarchaea archaeon]
LLAPMSLNPKSGLVSLPLAPERLENFSALDASPVDASAHRWTLPNATHVLKYIRAPQVSLKMAAI